MSTRPNILPPNASPLMRAVDQAVPQWDALPLALHGPVYGHPQALAPWLAGEWGLGQFARYFNGNTGQLIAAGVPWLLQRGTAAGVRRALAWLGLSIGVTIEEDGARLHIDPGQMVTTEQAASIAHVVRATVGAHVHFYRIYHGLDVRPLRWDQSPTWDNAVWDYESGTPINVDPWGEDVLLSQQQMQRRWVQRPSRASHTTRTIRNARAFERWPEWRWDNFRFDSAAQPLHAMSGRAIRRTLATPESPRATSAPRECSQGITRHMLAPNRTPLGGRHIVTGTTLPPYRAPVTWQTPGTWDARQWVRSIPHQSTATP